MNLVVQNVMPSFVHLSIGSSLSSNVQKCKQCGPYLSVRKNFCKFSPVNTVQTNSGLTRVKTNPG